MTNTTSPAESMGAPSAAAAYYRWEFPEKPVAIHIALDLVDRLEKQAIERFKDTTKRVSEMGGVLVGRVMPGAKRAVFIDGFEQVECDESHGARYSLGDPDKETLEAAFDRARNAGDIVGFVRSNARSSLMFDDDDQEMAKKFFSDPNHVFLLIRPYSMKPSLAGFFFWESGAINGEASYLQFPFRSSELLKDFAQFIVTAAPEKPATAPPVSREPLMMPKREERPPISFKREEPKPAPVVREEPPPPPPPPVMKHEEPAPAKEPSFTFRREEPKPGTVVPPRREETAPPPVAKREETKPSFLPPKREETAPPPVARREETKPSFMPPKREEPAPPVSFRREPPAMKREETKPSFMPPKREETAPPVSFKREEAAPPPPPPVMKREEPKPPVVPQKREEPSQVSFRREERPPVAPVAKREEPPKATPAPPPPAMKREEPRPPVTPAPKAAAPTVVPKEVPPPPKKEERPAPPPPQVVVKKEEKPPVTLKKEEKPIVTAVPPKREEPRIEEKPAAAAVVKPVEQAKAPEVVVPVVKKEEPARIPALVEVAAERPGSSRLKWVIAAVVLIGVLIGAYFMFFSGVKTATQQAVSDKLDLKVESNAGQLILTWNQRASAIATATRGTLSITDGEHQENVDIDLDQLKKGSIVYSPITNDVSFRLEVTDVKGGKSTSETLRRLVGRPSPAPIGGTIQAGVKPAPAAAAMPPVAGQPAAATPGATPAAPAPATQTPAAAPPAAEAPKVTTTTAVTAQVPVAGSLAARLRQAEPTELPAPPTIGGGGALGSAPVQSPSMPGAPAPAPTTSATRTPPPPAPAAAPAAPVKTGGQAQEARLLRRVAPVYPPLARQTRVSGIVRVQVAVGKDGKVKKATAISGPPLLRSAATDAVMKWVYSPALLNGEPVDAETQVDVNFTL